MKQNMEGLSEHNAWAKPSLKPMTH